MEECRRRGRVSRDGEEILGRFPVDILRYILQYLSMEEIGIFDTAIVNHVIRSHFLETLSGYMMFDIFKKCRGLKEINWLTLRRIMVSDIILQRGSPWTDPSVFPAATFMSIFNLFLQQNSHCLKSIYLPGCKFVVDFYSIFHNCSLLKELFLVESCISDEGIHQLLGVHSCPGDNLTFLDLSYCERLTDISMSLICQKCRRLKHLEVNYIPKISDTLVQEIKHWNLDINHLGLSGTSITDVSVLFLLDILPDLEALSIENCRNVSGDAKTRVMGVIIPRQLRSLEPSIQLLGLESVGIAVRDGESLFYAHQCSLATGLERVVRMGIVEDLIQFLTREENPTLQYQSSLCLTNIAAGPSEFAQIVVRGGAVPHFIKLLSSLNLNIVEQATWALGNISGDCVASRDLVLSCGALPKLLTIDLSRRSIVRTLTWTVSNLFRGKPSPAIGDLIVAFPFLIEQLTNEDEESQMNACYALHYICTGDPEVSQKFVEAGFFPPLLNILRTVDLSNILSPALHVICNTLANDFHTQIILDMGILPLLNRLLDHPNDKVKRDACRTLSNITAGTIEEIQAVIDADFIPKLIKLGYCCTPEVFEECLWCLGNATEKRNMNQVEYLIQQGILPFLVVALNSSEMRILSYCLTTIHHIALTDISFHRLILDHVGSFLEELYTSSSSSAIDTLTTPDLWTILQNGNSLLGCDQKS